MQGWVAYRTRKDRKLALDLRPAHLREAGQVPHPGQGDRHLRQRHLAGLRRGGEVAHGQSRYQHTTRISRRSPTAGRGREPDVHPRQRRTPRPAGASRSPAAGRAVCCLCTRSATAVDAWRDGGYQGARRSRAGLFAYWFDEDHEVAGFRRAIPLLLLPAGGDRDAGLAG